MSGHDKTESAVTLGRNTQHYEAELKRMEFEELTGQLIRAEDFRDDLVKTLKPVMLTLDTLVDVVEREAGLSPEQAIKVQELIDRERENLYKRIADDEAPTH